MTEFITGLILGAMLTFFVMEYNRRKSYLISQISNTHKNTENIQWQNMMNYDGSERGQKTSED